MRKINNMAISFDDILLVPRYSRNKSRASADLTTNIGNFKLKLPIIASPMDTICEADMAIAMYTAGGIGIIHRYMTIPSQKDQLKKVKSYDANALVGAAVGAVGDYLSRAAAMIDVGADLILVDTAHGHHYMAGLAVDDIKNRFPEIHVMAGNVGTPQGFKFLENAGADSIRVSVGGGSACDTRQVAGSGVPTAQAILDIAETNPRATIIADGGIKNSGDIAKALGLGASAVMLGSLLSGTTETPGKIVEKDGKTFKKFRGMASSEAQEDWRGYSTIAEGVTTYVDYKGSVVDVLQKLRMGIGSAFSYSGVENIKDLREFGEYMIITQASQRENLPHILNK